MGFLLYSRDIEKVGPEKGQNAFILFVSLDWSIKEIDMGLLLLLLYEKNKPIVLIARLVEPNSTPRDI